MSVCKKRHLNQTATLAQSKYWGKKKTSMLIKVFLSSEIELGWFLLSLHEAKEEYKYNIH